MLLNLAIECSGVAGSVALHAGDDLLASRPLPPELGSVQTLAATIQSMLNQHSAPAAQGVGLISVTCGPGSFTGLRVGLATAQMLAFAWRIPVAPVDTLASIALGAAQDRQNRDQSVPAIIIPVLNAFRNQVFAGAWLLNGPLQSETAPTQWAPAQVVDARAWQAQPWQALIRTNPDADCSDEIPTDCPVLVSGPGLKTYQPVASNGLVLAEPRLWEPTAACVGQLGWQMYRRGMVVSAHKLRPNYVRASAAEEQRR